MLMDQANNWILLLTLVSSIAIVYFISYLILRCSTKIMPIIGETGNNVMMRLMGLILMVIAVECFMTGLRPLLVDMIHQGVIG